MDNINWGISQLRSFDQVGLEDDDATFNSNMPPISSLFLSSPSPISPSSEFFNSSNILSSPTTTDQDYRWRSTSSEDQQRNKKETNYSDYFSFQSSSSKEPLKKYETWIFNEATKNQTNLSSVQKFSSPEMEASKQKIEGNLPSGSAVQKRSDSEDGYNWRKYGENQVKGSENIRSYYKCTNPSCSVKKKVERNLEGQITEIVHKGSHNHPKPPASKRASLHSISSSQHSWTCINSGVSDQSVVTLGTPKMEIVSMQEVSVGEEDFEQTSQTSYCGGDEDDFGPEGKRRKGENYEMDESRTVRKPIVVVQTTSEIDILDDGYRWRKYGQKVVKGNPNPRSYYKCTTQGCMVRKHVERAAHDAEAVITTYEGKHNHGVPESKRSSLNSTNTGNNIGVPMRPSVVTNYSSFPNSVYNARPLPTYESPYEPFPLEMFHSPNASHAQHGSDVKKYEH